MTRAYLDLFCGLSGDMMLGALVDAGLPLGDLKRGLAKIPLKGYSLSSRRVQKGPIWATKVDVAISGSRPRAPRRKPPVHPAPAPHDGHGHGHGHGHEHAPGPRRGGSPGHPHSSLKEILALIRTSALDSRVKDAALDCFQRLGQVEGRIHGVPTSRVRFHEVGAVDSIVDIVGSCLGLHLLGVDDVFCSQVPIAHGLIHTEHGPLPNPGPATLALLPGFPLVPVPLDREILTPTGAALLASLVREPGRFPEMTLSAVGWGAGDWDLEERPNVTRLLLGETPKKEESDSIYLVETNLDNVSGELVGYLFEKLFAAGAVDVFTTPIQMKKSRPGIQVSALVPPSRREAVEESLLRETPTFGVRRTLMERRKLPRELVTANTPYGPIRFKIGSLGGQVLKAQPEYEDVKAAAERHGVPLARVYEAAQKARPRPR
jgi:uncharacterized protein (TIGR00299 family) protein